jgi:phosphoglycolate phosphatase
VISAAGNAKDVTAVRRTVLMDLDGTISDPAIGIYASFRHALASLGRPWPDGRPLEWIIGPPLRESFGAVLGADAALCAEALQHYRAHYAAGAMFENTLYPGMADAVAALEAAGFRLFVATSKLTAFAERIIDHFGLAGRFAGVYGSSLDGRIDQKADIIALCLENEAIDPATCVMVGDRKHDVLGAAANRLPCIGVSWGYGGVAELSAAGAALICERPAALPGAVERAMPVLRVAGLDPAPS